MLPTESAGTSSDQLSRRLCTSPIAPLTVGRRRNNASRAQQVLRCEEVGIGTIAFASYAELYQKELSAGRPDPFHAFKVVPASKKHACAQICGVLERALCRSA